MFHSIWSTYPDISKTETYWGEEISWIEGWFCGSEYGFSN